MSGITPYSQEAEEALIGAVIVNPDAFALVAQFLSAQDFYILRHTYIWEVLERLEARGESFDYVSVLEELKVMGRLTEIGGPAYITHLTNAMPSSMHAELYGRIVQRAAIRRRLLAACDDIRSLALNEELPIEQVTDESEARLFSVTQRLHVKGRGTMGEAASDYLDYLDALMQHGQARGIPTGLKGFDALLGGFVGGEVSVLAGPPKMGKTAALLSIAHNVARIGGHVVFFLSEMTEHEMTGRLLSMLSGIPQSILRTGPLTPVMYEKLSDALALMVKLPIRWVSDFEHFTPLQMRRKLRIIASEQPIHLVIGDGLYEMESHRSEDVKASEQMKLRSILQDTREVARDFKLPILLSHQFNRMAEGRDNKWPRLSDLGDSSWVGKTPHAIIGLYREGYYSDQPILNDVTQWILMASRNGGTLGHAPMRFDRTRGLYRDLNDGDKD